MTRDEILRMAREAEICLEDGSSSLYLAFDHELERFAALVATAEREACAIACEVHATAVINDGKQSAWGIAHECAAAVRKRSAA